MDFKLNKNNLNFRVYTATETPETGIENDIAIITTTPMTNWVLSPDAPRGIPRCDGDVWLQYSVYGDLANILITNALFVSVHRAYQYVNGAWVEMSVMGYQDGVWSPRWDGILYGNGNEDNSITGGWIAQQISLPSGTAVPISITDNGDSVKIVTGRSGSFGGVYRTANPVKVGGKALTFKGSAVGNKNPRYCTLFVWSAMGGSVAENIVLEYDFPSNFEGEVTLNVPDGVENCYVGFHVYGSAVNIVMEKLYLN